MSTVAASPAPVAAPAAPPIVAPAVVPTDPKPFSLREHRDAKANPAPAPKVEDAALDPDVAADPELAKEIDAIEKPAADETPQQKAARTKRNKQAADKAIKTRLANARDREKTRADALERELTELRSRQAPAPGTPGAATPSQPAPAGAATSDTRPKPTLKDFPLEKFKDDDDPYAAQSAALAEAVADWKFEQREHAAAQSRQREQAEQQDRELVKGYDTKLADARSRIADFDAVVSKASFPSTPISLDVFKAVMKSEHAGDVAYALAKHPERTRAILHMTKDDAIRAIGKVEAEVESALTAATKAAEAPTHVTPVAEPVAPVTAAAGTGATPSNPVTKGTALSVRQYREYKKSRGIA